MIETPRVVETSGWSKVEWVSAAGGAKKYKPGYVASTSGSELRIDTRRGGAQQVHVGYLKTYSSTAVASLGCVAPCTCPAQDLRAHAHPRTSTTTLSPSVRAESPSSTNCTLRLSLSTDGQQFKLISLHVDAADGDRR